MTRTEQIARYLEAFKVWNTLGPTDGEASLPEFNASVSGALGTDRTPAAWVNEAEAHAQAGVDFAGQVYAAESLGEVAASNFVCGYSAADSLAGARQWLATDSDDDEMMHADAADGAGMALLG